MLIPSTQVVFEGLSRDYYARRKELEVRQFDGCVRLAFADFEGVIFYTRGKPETALEECGTWMALGDELIAPLENKAAVTDGSMAIYGLSRDLLDFFKDRRVGSSVETETAPLLGLKSLLDSLLRDRSVCVFRAKGPGWAGYAFVAAGRVVGAIYAADRESFGGEQATAALRAVSGKATVVMHFLEGGAPFVEVTPSVEMPPEASAAQAPVEVMHPPEPGFAPAKAVIVTPPPAAAGGDEPSVDLKVVTSADPDILPRHPSKLSALESLEDRSVVWVDEATLERLHVKDAGLASMVIPGGRTEHVVLLKMELLSAPGSFAVVPRKLRRRLSLVPGTIVTLKPGSALVPVR